MMNLFFFQDILLSAGPPPDPKQVLIEPTSSAYFYSCLLGIVLLGLTWFRALEKFKIVLYCCAIICIATAPLIGMTLEGWIGAYPTIDKQGSVFFFEQGVHKMIIFNPIDALNHRGVQLIGFHMGHLWITEIFALFVNSNVAFNLHMVLNLGLNVGMTYLLISRVKNDTQALIFSTIFGLGIHTILDIQWYTIEKSSLYCLPIFWMALKNRWSPRVLGLTFFSICFINLYFGMICALFAPLYLGIEKKFLRKYFALFIAGVLVAAGQIWLTQKAPTLATPEEYLTMRAAQDCFSLGELKWARIPMLLAINPIALSLGIYAAVQKNWNKELTCAAVFFFLSLGPNFVWNIPNPMYLLWTKIPMLWRFSEPEIFFHITYLVLLKNAASREWKP